VHGIILNKQTTPQKDENIATGRPPKPTKRNKKKTILVKATIYTVNLYTLYIYTVNLYTLYIYTVNLYTLYIYTKNCYTIM